MYDIVATLSAKILPANKNYPVSGKRKSISVKPEVHERYRKAAIKLSTRQKRVTIAELVEVASKHLDEISVADN